MVKLSRIDAKSMLFFSQDNYRQIIFQYFSSVINWYFQVDISCKWIMNPNGHHCGKQFHYMADVVHHITMDHVGGPGKNHIFFTKFSTFYNNFETSKNWTCWFLMHLGCPRSPKIYNYQFLRKLKLIKLKKFFL